MEKFGAIRRVLIYTLALNLAVTGVKLAIGFLSGSLSVTADGYDSLLNSAANVVGLAGLYIASRPPDPQHPYGHRRYETLATVGIAVLIFATTVQLLQSAIGRLLQEPVTPSVTALTFAAPAFSIAVQGYVAVYEYGRGRDLRSQILTADALHTRADVLVSVSVIAGLVAVQLGYPRADPILAILIAAFIAGIGVEIVRDSSRVLADAAAVDPAEIERIALSVPGVRAVHRVRSRGQQDEIYVDLHVRVAPGMPVRQAHEIAHRVEKALSNRIEGLHDAVVHIEPEEVPEHDEQDLNDRIREAASRLPGVRLSGVQAHDVGGRLYIILHLEPERPLSEQQTHELADRAEAMLRSVIPETSDVDIHIEPGLGGEGTLAVDERTYQEVRAALDEAAGEMGTLGDCYDLVVSRAREGLRVSARWECAPGLSEEQARVLDEGLEERVRERLPSASYVVVRVEPAAGRAKAGRQCPRPPGGDRAMGRSRSHE